MWAFNIDVKFEIWIILANAYSLFVKYLSGLKTSRIEKS